MTQAKRVLSTPPTNTPVGTTRRRFLSQAAGAAAGGTVLALAAIPPVARAAAPREALDGSKAKRPLKRWTRRWRERQDAIVGDSWDAQLAAERDFRTRQMAVAKVTPRDEDDLMLKAAVAAVYDKVKHASYGDVALISYSVALDLINLRMPA